ncbi:MAG TPA: class I SAM-dependent methyltransferase [Dinghuibacter sp.]|jgi:ubiquinone/menaquinone biosynthesis C-methylase UbiE|uniref:class I SAM-dependent methyltransferase n=1 Tax=Dinghuibacter sp. TaxID=2024697 RepID=UPI002BA432D5|nr:class I SAM-dependent methyltransferase [Dinghuibacter sp.]HTJ14633.1 class I SAM-dependent methyltransferase [Dinghuibacter sp.]
MRLSEAIELFDRPVLRDVVGDAPVRWADLGCGSGLFTEALARFLPAGSTIYGLDLRPMLQSDLVCGVHLVPVKTDFVNIPLPVAGLDGILMANSLHYVEDKAAFLSTLTRSMHPGHPESAPLRPERPLLVVEYDTDTPVPTWVPWPVSLAKLRPLMAIAGWPKVDKLGERPSAFGRSNIYSALAKIR